MQLVETSRWGRKGHTKRALSSRRQSARHRREQACGGIGWQRRRRQCMIGKRLRRQGRLHGIDGYDTVSIALQACILANRVAVSHTFLANIAWVLAVSSHDGM